MLIKVSCWAINVSTTSAFLFPSSDKCLILAFDTAVKAVSDPEKKADINNNHKIDPIKIASVVSIYLNPTDIRKSLITLSSTPFFIKASPIPLSKIKVFLSSFLFLSFDKISVISIALSSTFRSEQ